MNNLPATDRLRRLAEERRAFQTGVTQELQSISAEIAEYCERIATSNSPSSNGMDEVGDSLVRLHEAVRLSQQLIEVLTGPDSPAPVVGGTTLFSEPYSLTSSRG